LEDTPIWLTITTKKHIVDTKRLKPHKISLPHPLNTSPNTSICLITADPQRTYKDIVASPAFPSELASRITRVVGIKKIKAKWTQYEAQRKLFAEHDIFVADDRIITSLSKPLGKTFYKTTTKRPIPVSISVPTPRTDGKRISRAQESGPTPPLPAKAIADEITKAINSAVVNLTPSTNTAIRIGYASWSAQELAENIEAVSTAMIEKHIPQKWRNVKGIHIKSPTSAALPIWLADELWVDEGDVLDEQQVEVLREANIGKKRKARALVETKVAEEEVKAIEGAKGKKDKKRKLAESNDDKLDEEIKARKESLKKQKREAEKSVGDEVPKGTKKEKKSKKVVLEA
jgi:ribosome biogenesis protein UTP30